MTQKDREEQKELANVRAILDHYAPRPSFTGPYEGLDIYGDLLPLNGTGGGDLLTCIDFKREYDLEARVSKAQEEGLEKVAKELEKGKSRVGLLLTDIFGHKMTDAVAAALIHHAVLSGVPYELETHGEVTSELFERVNNQFYLPGKAVKPATVMYAEVNAYGKGKFISAGHPFPLIFRARKGEFDREPAAAWESSQPIGVLPSRNHIDRKMKSNYDVFKDPYVVNRFTLESGDLAVFYTDGLEDHGKKFGKRWFPQHAEALFRKFKDQSSKLITEEVLADVVTYAHTQDDITLVVAKKT